MLYAILKPLAAAVFRLFFRLRAVGAEQVPRHGPVLIAANHQSLLDPPLIGAIAPRPLWFLAKAELFRIPLFGPFIARLHARPVRREGADAGALRTALRVLADGGALLVFPEGTRGTEGRLGPAKAGAGMLAVMSGAPVVPAYITGSGRAWPKGRRLPRPGRVAVFFGPPLRFARSEGAGRKEGYEAASLAMMAAIARLQPATPDGGPRPTVPTTEETAGTTSASRGEIY
jgi:1-acyl-sn-glycerol-3-phosphate acyltransferase